MLYLPYVMRPDAVFRRSDAMPFYNPQNRFYSAAGAFRSSSAFCMVPHRSFSTQIFA